MKKNDTIELNISGYSTDGSGISRHDGMVVFVAGALDGEIIDARILKVGKSSAYAKIERIIEASPERVASDCPYFPACGGCNLRHMSYFEELKLKKARVQDALYRIGGLDIEVSEIIPSDEVISYRNKAQYPVANAGRGPAYGFYRARSHELVPVRRCLLQTEEADRAAAAVTQWMKAFSIPAYDETSKKGVIRHIFVRSGVYETMVCLVANADKLPKVSYLIDALQDACPKLESIMLSVNKADTNVILGDKYVRIWGREQIYDTMMGLYFTLSPASFYQINRLQAEKLYTKAIELAAVDKTHTVLDLYCGTGTITLAMARAAGQVIGVEIVQAAVLDAEKNALANGIDNARFICADAAEAAFRLDAEGVKPDVIVVDPPRKGLSLDTIDVVSGMSPERIVYVSCDPATLARDLKLFSERGYKTISTTALDMFPRCAHVETVVLLSRKTPDDVIDVDWDLDELDITSAEAKATYAKIKEYVLKTNGFKVSNLYISQVKRKLGLEMGTNYNLPKSEDAKVPQCPEEKEKAIIAALEHFEMA